MKKWVVLFSLLFLSCKKESYVLIDCVKGQVLSKKDKRPIKDVNIQVSKFSTNDFGTIKTDKDGNFFIVGYEVHNYQDLHLQNQISYDFIFEKDGFRTISVDVRNFKKDKVLTTLDTIDVGKIYLNNN